MTLLHAAQLGLAFGSRQVFEGVTLTLAEGERVGLVGVNGSGKTSLLKMLAGALAPDDGEVQRRRGMSTTYLPQEPSFVEGATVESELKVASAPLRAALEEYAVLAAATELRGADADDRAVNRMAALAEHIEHLGGWDTEHLARTLLDRLGVKEWERPVAELSGGLRKRVAIARALLSRPDLLLLDEPTNHLDADTVDWLEDELDKLPGALLLVTHDRYFLDDLVDRIVEIQAGGGVVSYPGNYEAYLEAKLIESQESKVKEHKRERWIAQEIAWLRRGVEARRTKSKARIGRARKLMAERGPAKVAVAELAIVAAPRLGGVVIEAEGVSKRFGDRAVLNGVDFILQRGERVGIVGPNGVGKTTLLRVLLGELAPDSGKVAIGQRTRVAYYDQQRANLDPEKTVYDAAWGEDFIELGGKRVALRDYLDDLLFPVPMQRMQVKALSGGERNRLLLARLFLEGANVLVLDEPTNDLDIVTLNVLERLLLQFQGSVLLVTHDRYFLDKVATTILSLDGSGGAVRYEGNYEMYSLLKARGQIARASTPPSEARSESAPAASTAQRKARKLGFKEQRELEGIEAEIEKSERRKAELETALGDPALYSSGGGSQVPTLRAELEVATRAVERLYARWQELEQLGSQ